LSRNENSSFSAGISSPSAKAIVYVLANNTPGDVHHLLNKALTEAPLSLNQYQIDALLDILKTASIPYAHVAEHRVEDQVSRHCVRCHHDYLEKDNGWLACTIDHDAPQ
ncbi:hypothetical protein DFH06DRAFT_965906, partial [Mycena polygramma]